MLLQTQAAGPLLGEHTCSNRQFAKFAYLSSRGKTDKKSKASGGKKFQSAVFAHSDRYEIHSFYNALTRPLPISGECVAINVTIPGFGLLADIPTQLKLGQVPARPMFVLTLSDVT